MAEHFEIAIIGAGPAGLGAATNAAKKGLSHVLFEKGEIGNTVFDYQLRKHVMAEPGQLPLRAEVGFDAGSREAVLAEWNDAIERNGVRVQRSEVTKIEKRDDGKFNLTTPDGVFEADSVVLAIGMQGTPRKMGVPGEDDFDHVAYTLRDPDEFEDQDIIVVGAGDAAIENAIALAQKNRVSIVNRSGEFPRAKDANAALITGAIKSGKIRGFYNTTMNRVEAEYTYVNTPDGETAVKCSHLIARIGAVMPRRFLEDCGIKFSSEDREAIPVVDSTYQSSVEGLYILGALIGYPLIKQAINQGYEVIEHILGNHVEPADQVLIEAALEKLPGAANDNLEMIRGALPLFEDLSEPQFREMIIDSTVHTLKPGATVFEKNDYTDSFYSVVSGSIEVMLPGDKRLELPSGIFFGEMSLLSGRRRSATILMGKEGVLLETPRKQMLKLINSVPSVKKKIDSHFMRRALETKIFPEVDPAFIESLVQKAEMRNYRKGDVLMKEGEVGEELFVIRKGSVKVSRRDKTGIDVAQTYLPAGNYVGEMALLKEAEDVRSATVTAAVPTETIVIQKGDFRALLGKSPELEQRIRKVSEEHAIENLTAQRDEESAGILDFMVQQGVTDAENVLVIDSDLCVACDNCESACAATHGGASRLDRKGGTSFASIQVPISCRHCENPLCMTDCPPDALTRMPNGEVIIRESCIGCGNCQRNCPYGVIQMVYDKPTGISSLLSLFSGKKKEKGAAKAAKCDMCGTLPGGPACVRACPTGAAMRLNPSQLLQVISSK